MPRNDASDVASGETLSFALLTEHFKSSHLIHEIKMSCYSNHFIESYCEVTLLQPHFEMAKIPPLPMAAAQLRYSTRRVTF